MEHLWYASFGSNLLRARFEKYLNGGTPARATGHPEHGARDSSDPVDQMVLTVDHEIFFAHSSQKWDGGGVAFLDTAVGTDGSSTRCRAYKITVEQFEDVYQQENGADAPVLLDLDGLGRHGVVEQHDGLYGLALLLSTHDDGCPVVTITTGRTDLELNAPSVGYASTMAQGLMECMGIARDEAVDYVLGIRGVDETLRRSELIDTL